MPSPLPYVPSYGKITTLFSKIRSARIPDSFTQAYLSDTLGLTSSGDRPLIPLLRALGFIDASGKPSASYGGLKNSAKAGAVLAEGIHHAFEPLFAANEQAHTLTGDALKGLIAQVAGTDDEVTKRTAGTFKTLVDLADFDALEEVEEEEEDEEVEEGAGDLAPPPGRGVVPPGALKPEFHYNIQVHLPSNGSEETYLNIFNALRKAFS